MSQPYTAAVTLLALLVYFLITGAVARARAQFGIKAPAVTGNEHFERAYRVQMNTLEWMPIFLPAIWLAALYVNDVFAAVVGVVWLAGRVLYLQGYTQAAEKRETGYFVQAIAAGVLWATALVGVIKSLLAG
jgi:glutathione S-transferase